MFIKFKTENLIAKLQNSNQNFTFSWVNLIGFSTTWPEGATLLGWPKSIYHLMTHCAAYTTVSLNEFFYRKARDVVEGIHLIPNSPKIVNF